jgi:putative ABC transport system permease protein
MRARPEVAFVSPRTRTLAATLELSSKTAPVILPAELIPSGQHDPLLKGLPRGPAGLHEVVFLTLIASLVGAEAESTREHENPCTKG